MNALQNEFGTIYKHSGKYFSGTVAMVKFTIATVMYTVVTIMYTVATVMCTVATIKIMTVGAL